MSEEIDFVITWTDSSDEDWNRERARYACDAGMDNGEERYRDWGLLKYWFRGVDEYAPWVRRIHLVTGGKLPGWLDTGNPRLHIVRHEDYVPEQFLPTFNSNVLELYLHRIEGLAEHFVYFNDDMFLLRGTARKDFFLKGKPRDMLAFQPIVANPANPVMSHIFLNNSLVLCKYFDKRTNVKRRPGGYFWPGYPPLYFFYNILEMAFPLYTGFYTVHGPAPFCKSTFREIWEKEEALLARVSRRRFRSEGDVSQYLFREWQKLSGNFRAGNVSRDFRYYEIGEDNGRLFDAIRKRKGRIICINDASADIDFVAVRRGLHDAFERILPEMSEFEMG